MDARASSLSLVALLAASCHQALPTRTCDPFHTPRLSSGPVPAGEERTSHAPYSAGDCSACHARRAALEGESPEGAARPGPALEPVNRQCVLCHEELFRSPPVRHPTAQAFCVTCHNPHNSRGRSLLLDEDSTRPCLTYSPPVLESAPRSRRTAEAPGEQGSGALR